jgi:hypothetical protein
VPNPGGRHHQNLIFYSCTKPPPQGAGLVETVCHNNTYVRAADGRPDESAGSYFLEDCIATTVPVLGVSGKKVNASDYEQLVEDGFLATWQWSPPPGNFALLELGFPPKNFSSHRIFDISI